MPNKSSLVAFLLSFLPGVGHLYMNRLFRGLLYGGGFFGSLFLIFMGVAFLNAPDDFLIPLALLAALTWVMNMLDMIIFLLRSQPYRLPGSYGSEQHGQHEQPSWDANPYSTQMAGQQEKTKIMLLSFIPGLGHYQLGLMHRGLTAMVSFFGVAVLVFFITIMTHNEGFAAFLLALPVLWFYTMFDALKQQGHKQAGLELVDRSIFEDFHFGDDYGRKNRTLATIIAIFPGAAHLYLSMTKRGVQLMAIFLFSIYILDVLRLSLFLFLIPILWFFSFFDALQSITKYENGTLIDKPIIENWTAYQRPIGMVLILLGGYYVFKDFLVPFIYQYLPTSRNFMYWITNFSQTLIVALLLIGGGVRLLMNRKQHVSTFSTFTDDAHSASHQSNPMPQHYLEIDEKKNP